MHWSDHHLTALSFHLVIGYPHSAKNTVGDGGGTPESWLIFRVVRMNDLGNLSWHRQQANT